MQTLPNNTTLRYTSALFVAALVGTLAFFAQQQAVVPAFFFPLLFPLMVGSITGAIVGWLSVGGRGWSASRSGVIALALASGAVVFAIESAWAYRTYAAAANAALEQNPLGKMVQAADAEAFRPATPWRFIAAQMDRSGGWWLVDGLLVCGATVVAALVITTQLSQSKVGQPNGEVP